MRAHGRAGDERRASFFSRSAIDCAISASTSLSEILPFDADRWSSKALEGVISTERLDFLLEIVSDGQNKLLTVGGKQQKRFLPRQIEHREEIERRIVEMNGAIRNQN